jgi:ELWxxDGT repeat protein
MRSSRQRRRLMAHRSDFTTVDVASEPLEGRALLSATVQSFANINLTNPWATVHEIEAVGSDVYFVASENNSSSLDLWKSDGTTTGTIRLAGLGSKGSGPHHLTNVNGTLFFRGYSAAEGHELWKTNGTVTGTTLIRSLKPGPAGTTLNNFTSLNGALYFSAEGHLHRSNGTSAGTIRIKDLVPGVSDEVSHIETVGNTLFFAARSTSTGFDLYRSNGIGAGTVRMTDVPSGTLSNLTKVGASLFFVRNHHELWKTSSDLQTANLVKSYESFGLLGELTDVNGTVFFNSNNNEILKSDGTSEGTVSLRYIGDAAHNLFGWNGALYFSGGTSFQGNGEELWRSDGTTNGTVQLKDINTDFNEGYGFGSYPSGFLEFNGQLHFHAGGLWKTNGTTAGTVAVDAVSSPLMANANGTLYYFSPLAGGMGLRKLASGSVGPVNVPRSGSGTGHSNPTKPVLHNGAVYFVADDSVTGHELRRRNSNGTIDLIADITPGPAGTLIGQMISMNGLLYFTAFMSNLGQSLWRTDGTTAGTIKLAGVTLLQTGVNEPMMVAAGDLIFFAGSTNVGVELWKTDGTVSGTALVKDIDPGTTNGYYGVYPRSSSPSSLTNVNGTLFFAASDGANGRELWKSDGTTAGTVVVKDLFPGSQQYYPYEVYSSGPTAFANRNGVLHFLARDATGVRFWESNGQSEGTLPVSSVIPDLQNVGPVLDVDGRLFFVGAKGSITQELWTSDRTVAGTTFLKDIRPGSSSSQISNMTGMDGLLYFTANDGVHGIELWRSNGTASGTVMVRDIRIGSVQDQPGSSDPQELTPINGVLYFTADDGKNGVELWRTNGTAAGATKISELVSGLGSTRPTGLTAWNNSLLFSGNSALGRELWRVRSAPPVLSFSTTDVIFTEGAAPAPLTPDAILTDVDTSILVGGQLTISIVNPKAGDEIRIAGSSLIGQVGSSVQYLNIGMGTTPPTISKTTLTVNLNLNATTSRVQELLRAVAFFSGSDSPSSVVRNVRITLTDGEGGKLVRARRVQVTPVNDTPTLNTSASVNYQRNNSAGAAFAATALITDVDSFSIDGGELQISVTGGEMEANRIFLSGAGFTLDDSGNLLRAGVIIGALNPNAGLGVNSFRVTFNSNARLGHAQQLLRSLRFGTVGSTSNQDRQVTISLNDGDGGLGTVISNVIVKVTS